MASQWTTPTTPDFVIRPVVVSAARNMLSGIPILINFEVKWTLTSDTAPTAAEFDEWVDSLRTYLVTNGWFNVVISQATTSTRQLV
jgi:hypothetical protein